MRRLITNYFYTLNMQITTINFHILVIIKAIMDIVFLLHLVNKLSQWNNITVLLENFRLVHLYYG